MIGNTFELRAPGIDVRVFAEHPPSASPRLAAALRAVGLRVPMYPAPSPYRSEPAA